MANKGISYMHLKQQNPQSQALKTSPKERVAEFIGSEFAFIFSLIKRYKNLSEVSIYNEGCFYIKYGGKSKKFKEPKFTAQYLRFLQDKIASFTNNHLEDEYPHMVTNIPSIGWRVACSRPPDAKFFTFSIRIPSTRIFTLADFINDKNIIKELISLVKSRVATTILVAGGTSTGKTSFLNALLQYIDDGVRVASVENMSEINLPAKTIWYPLVISESINKLTATKDKVPPYQIAVDMVNRNDPDVVVFGELTQASAAYWLRVANIGKTVLATIHANTATGAIDALLQNISLATKNNVYTRDYITNYVTYVLILKAGFEKNSKKLVRKAEFFRLKKPPEETLFERVKH